MLNFVLLNIGVDAMNFFANAVDEVNKVRASSPILKVLLWPVSYALLICKVLCKTTTLGVMSLKYQEIPAIIKHSGNRLYSSSANSIYCFSKVGLMIFFIDFYCFMHVLFMIFNGRFERHWWLYAWFAAKIPSILMPFMSLTPMQRLPFWFLNIPFTIFETILGVFFIWSIGFGINFELDHFYNHWKKHYRYRAATGNRKLAVELLVYIYIISKFAILFDYICDDHAQIRLERLEFPHELTHGALGIDFDVLNALVEPDTVANLRYGVLFLLALSSLGVYSIILAGWSSNSKYAFIGALRSAAQMISYEVAISLIILPIVIMAGSLNLTMITHIQNITTWFVWPLLPVSILFLIAMLAETNRTPFDLPEAEAELVAGYNVDYSSLPFAMFFLGEYCNMILISTVYCLFFLGGGLNSLGLPVAVILAAKAAVTWVFFVIVRATLPRYRYDQLMDIGWKVFLPVSGSFLLLTFGILVYFDALPVANELPLVAPMLALLTPFVLVQNKNRAYAMQKAAVKSQMLLSTVLFISWFPLSSGYILAPLFGFVWGYYGPKKYSYYLARATFPRLALLGCRLPKWFFIPHCFLSLILDPNVWFVINVWYSVILIPALYSICSAQYQGAFEWQERAATPGPLTQHAVWLMCRFLVYAERIVRVPAFSDFGAGVLAYLYFYAPCALLPVVISDRCARLSCTFILSCACILTPMILGFIRRSPRYAALARWQRYFLVFIVLSFPLLTAQILFEWIELFYAVTTTAPQLNGQITSVTISTRFCAVRWIWSAAAYTEAIEAAVRWHLAQRSYLSDAECAWIKQQMAPRLPGLISEWRAGFPKEAAAKMLQLLTSFEKEVLGPLPVPPPPVGCVDWICRLFYK